jgi:hypothetical protein
MTKEEIERAHEQPTKSWTVAEINSRINALLDHMENRIERRVGQELTHRAVLAAPAAGRFGFLNAAAWFVMGAAVTYWALRSLEAAE